MNSIRLEPLRDEIVLLTIDLPGKSANVLTETLWEDLASATDQLTADPPRGVILVSAKPTVYVAGADLSLIERSLDWSDERIVRFCEEGRAIMARFSQLPTVSVAAIHGACVGGGLELALWCDIRIVDDNQKTLLGMPEVRLGLVPGWAGTVRLPRLIGLGPAIDLVTSGRLVEPAEALELRLVSAVVRKENLIDQSVQAIHSARESGTYLERRRELEGPVDDLPDDLVRLAGSAQNRIDARLELDRTAPSIVLEHMIESSSMNAREACGGESRAMARVWGSPENRGLLHWFLTEERAKKTRPRSDTAAPLRPDSIGIVGAGLMGRRIAQLSLAAGYRVLLFDADRTKLLEAVESLQATSPNRGSATAASSIESFVDCDLVVESIVEKLSVKRLLLERLCQVVGEEVVLATNTSTIPVADIATSVSRPDRFIGLHFCCPVEPMRLVEVVRGEATSDRTLDVALGLVRAFRKTPVVVADYPGFVVNRLLCPVFDEALLLLQQGITAPEIDAPFRKFGFAAGPLEMIDFIGVDTIMYAGETFLRTLPDLISLTPILPALVKRGRLGRKTGVGFYRYHQFDGPPVDDPELVDILARYQLEQMPLEEDELLSRLLDRMIDAARGVLASRIVPDPMDVDLCSVLGTTFPAVKGGVLFWADDGCKSGH